MKYQDFLAAKLIKKVEYGFDDVPENEINSHLFDFQRAIVRCALKAGRYAIFAGTGLGKTGMSLSWADYLVNRTESKALILAPLGVAKQTVKDASKFDITVNYIKCDRDIADGINITNYERLENIDTSVFDIIVLDESSIIKSISGKYKQLIIDRFRNTQYRLCCSATPAPNDYMELGNQCEFLGVMSHTEMLSMYFIHDGGDTSKWILKHHAKNAFWEFLNTWSCMVTHPRDIGFDTPGYDLPGIEYYPVVVANKVNLEQNTLFTLEARSLNEQRKVRNDSLTDRCKAASDIINSNQHEQFLVWCETNAESTLMRKLIPDSVEVKGGDSNQHKEESAIAFAENRIRVLISKPKIFGFGMNWQQCHNCIFLGVTHSFEMYYQAVRRLYRFGQSEVVNVYIIQHELDGAIVDNLYRKERDAIAMQNEMVKHFKLDIRSVTNQRLEYRDRAFNFPDWLVSEVA